MQKPSKARIVLAGVSPETNNGDDTAPAIVTRVWGEHPAGGWTVNLKVLNDGLACEWKTSVVLFSTEDEARAYGIAGACYWPPRT